MNIQQPSPAVPVDPLIRDKEAAAMMRISTSTFWRRVRDRSLPQPIKFGGMARWARSEIVEVIERLKATRGAAV